MRLDLDLLFRVPSVATYDLSPDGKRLAFAWNKSGQSEIYLLEVEAGNVRMLTQPPESKVAPRFSPDGSRIVYAQDSQGDECFDIFDLNLKDLRTRNLTPDTPESIYPGLRWSPDGERLAFASNKSGKFSIYTMPVEGGLPEILLEHEYIDSEPEWAPDGSRIAFTSLVSGQDNGLFIASLKDHASERVAEKGKPLEASDPAWSPDGKSLAFYSAEKGMYDVGVFRLGEKSVSWLTEGKQECYSPVWSPRGDAVAYELNLEGNIAIAVNRLDEDVQTIQLAPGIHSDLRFSPDGERLFFLYNGPQHPNDLWMYSFADASFTQLTHSLPSGLDTSGFITPRPLRYGSSDGRMIPALLFTPRSRSGASVVYVHGGPTAQFMNSWNPLIQEFLDRGWAVLAPNYRGSTGYGREFREANRFVMGRLDLEDVVKGAEYLVTEGIGKQGRVAVTGGSFGGYLTMCALTKYPELWAAGSALVPFLNWFTEIANERDDLQYWDKQNMGDPEKDKERLHEASPIFYIDRIKAPVQMIAGAHDPRCPVSETLQAKEELVKRGKETDVMIYEDEGHGFRKLDNRLDAYKKTTEFLSKHLS